WNPARARVGAATVATGNRRTWADASVSAGRSGGRKASNEPTSPSTPQAMHDDRVRARWRVPDSERARVLPMALYVVRADSHARSPHATHRRHDTEDARKHTPAITPHDADELVRFFDALRTLMDVADRLHDPESERADPRIQSGAQKDSMPRWRQTTSG